MPRNEPRLTAFMSQDENMIKAYKDGKDLYAVIAQSIYDNDYNDNRENFPEGTEVTLADGTKQIAGTGEAKVIEAIGSFDAPWYYLIDTASGSKQISELKSGDGFVDADKISRTVLSNVRNGDTCTVSFE